MKYILVMILLACSCTLDTNPGKSDTGRVNATLEDADAGVTGDAP